MAVDLLLTTSLFLFLVLGAGPLLVPSSLGSPLQRVVVGIGAGLVALYLLAFLAYVGHWPGWAHGGIVAAAAGWGWLRRAAFGALWGDAEARSSLLGWLTLTCWAAGWQFAIVSYSGDGWAGDWIEHFDRARFFAQHWPTDVKFLGIYSVAARPPLANLLTAEFFVWTHATFPVYQLLQVLLSCLVYWPLRILFQRFVARPGRAVSAAWLTFVLLASPSLLENATFPWTKLLTAFFVLTAVVLLMPGATHSRTTRLAGWMAFTAAMLTHYSAGPWIVAFALAAWAAAPQSPRHWLRLPNVVIGGLCVTLFATWLSWSIATVGLSDTFTSNSTVSGVPGLDWRTRLATIGHNLWASLVPHVLRVIPPSDFMATNPIFDFRDTFFNLYQSNVLGLMGSVGAILAVWLWARNRTPVAPGTLRFWILFGIVGTVLGIAVNSERSIWGDAHICLLSLGLMGVTWVAARAPADALLRPLLLVGLSVDLCLGQALQLAVESMLLPRWLYPGATDAQIVMGGGIGATANFFGKAHVGEPYLADLPGSGVVAGLLLLSAIILLVSASRRSQSAAVPRSAS